MDAVVSSSNSSRAISIKDGTKKTFFQSNTALLALATVKDCMSISALLTLCWYSSCVSVFVPLHSRADV